MKILLLIVGFTCSVFAQAQQIPAGVWQLNDFKSGNALAYLKFERAPDGLRAVIVGIPKSSPLAKSPKCTTCPPRDARHNKPLQGMVVLDGLQAAGAGWVQGNWLDLEKGFSYMANLMVVNQNQIKVSVMYGKMEKARLLYRVK